MASATQDHWSDILRLSRRWRLEFNLTSLFSQIAEDSCKLLDVERTLIFLSDGQKLAPRAEWRRGEHLFLSNEQSIAERVAECGRPLFASFLADDPGGTRRAPRVVQCVPLIGSRGSLGCLYTESGESPSEASERRRRMLDMLSGEAVTALEYAMLYQSAITDPLTGLFTHRFFQQEAEQCIRRATRSEKPLSLLLFDLDHFKELNDSCGHEAGNKCLTEVSKLLVGSVRSGDVVARFGGDEFEVLLIDADCDAAVHVAEKIRRGIGELPMPGSVRVTATVGVASFPAHAADAHTLFMRADEAMYEAKEAGRNCVARSRAISQKEPSAGITQAQPQRPGAPEPPRQRTEVQIAEKIDGHPVIQRLGSGSTGEVLLVQQPELNRTVALKRPLTRELSDEQLASFEREVKTAASLEHPGVITIYNMGRDSDGRRYYTMKALRGRTLGDVFELRRRDVGQISKEYSTGQLLEAVQRVAETIAFAHEKGVAHLDLSPSNIVLGEFGEATVIDWGMSASVNTMVPGSSTSSSSGLWIIGSAEYRAPEQLAPRGEASKPADIFAIGAMLYEALTGTTPYAADSLNNTVTSVLAGKPQLPEERAPERGIDPVLSDICVSTLAADPAQRPTAHALAERLSRFLRRDTDWDVITFNHERPLLESDWMLKMGAWKLVDGAWAATGSNENLLLWKHPVGSAYRFICEAWADQPVELSLVGNGMRLEDNGGDRLRFYDGYCFQFGGEENTCTKLARNMVDVICEPIPLVQPGRHYVIELEYFDGWVHGYIDNQRFLSYRELYPMAAGPVGLYTFRPGAHFKPLEIRSHKPGLTVSALHAADELYDAGAYERARTRYLQLAAQHPRRLEGSEARFKAARCLIAMKENEVAIGELGSLQQTPFEPMALAELGWMQLRREENLSNEVAVTKDPYVALTYFRQLAAKFPKHQARWQIIDAAQHMLYHFFALPGRMIDMHRTAADMDRLALTLCDPPTHAQRACMDHLVWMLIELGEHKAALEELLAFMQRVPPEKHWYLNAALTYAALVNVRDDLIVTHHKAGLSSVLTGSQMEGGNLGWHIAVRKGLLSGRDLAEQCAPETGLPILLAQCRPEDAINYISRKQWGLTVEMHRCYAYVIESHHTGVQKNWAEMIKRLTGEHPEGSTPALDFKSRLAFENGEYEKAVEGSAYGDQSGDLRHPTWRRAVLREVFAHSLGVKCGSRRGMKNYKRYLAGMELELARIFSGEIEPVPGPNWPDPKWYPEARLWLARWLEAKGKKVAAREVVLPAVDPRYGLIHSQPGIAELLARTSNAR